MARRLCHQALEVGPWHAGQGRIAKHPGQGGVDPPGGRRRLRRSRWNGGEGVVPVVVECIGRDRQGLELGSGNRGAQAVATGVQLGTDGQPGPGGRRQAQDSRPDLCCSATYWRLNRPIGGEGMTSRSIVGSGGPDALPGMSVALTARGVSVRVKAHRPTHANVRNAPSSTAPGPPDSQPSSVPHPEDSGGPAPSAGRGGRAVHFHPY